MDGTNLDKGDLNESDDHMQLPVQNKRRKNEHRSDFRQMSKSSSLAGVITETGTDQNPAGTDQNSPGTQQNPAEPSSKTCEPGRNRPGTQQ